jgi:hypothetical protein
LKISYLPTVFAVYNNFYFFSFSGKDKLGVPASEPVRLVLECDGTQVEDGEYFRTLANNTVLLLLRQGERWYPTGVDVIKAGEFKKKNECLFFETR